METSSYFLINDCPEGYYSWPGRVLLTSSTQPRIIKKTAPKDTTHNLGPALKNIIFLRDYFRDFFLAGLRAGSNHNFLIIPESDGIFFCFLKICLHFVFKEIADRHSIRHPWRRSYSRRNFAIWENDKHFCKSVRHLNHDFSTGHF